ncbi:MAG: SET domain-containing protein [Deltaproteobacteria bacterium]|nr:SET domain-containing protein [Deltaproteobacteria bacterium]
MASSVYADIAYRCKVIAARCLLAAGQILPPFKDNLLEEIVDAPNWLEVKPSTLANAGNGLFTTKGVAAGERICRYIGTRKSLLDVLRTRDRRFVYMVNLNSFIDPGPHPKVLGRYVNHHFDAAHQNTGYLWHNGEVWYVASRDIAAGEELFTDYELFYWQTIERTKYRELFPGAHANR